MKKIPSIQTLAGIFVAALGAMVICGWMVRSAPLVRIRPEFVAMVLNTALCFMLVGIALLLPVLKLRRHALLEKSIGFIVIGIASLVLLETFFGVDLGIDLRSFHAWLADGNPRPGRMAPNTATGFILAGLILVLSHQVSSRRKGVLIQSATFLILLLGLTGLVGYLLQLDVLYGLKTVRMAIHTATGMVVAGIGLWGSWYRADWYKTRKYFTEGEKIIFVGTALLLVVALTAGIAGFAAQQSTFETALGANLRLVQKNQATIFHAEIEQTVAKVKINAGRPNLIRLARQLSLHPGEKALSDDLKVIAQSVLASGTSGIAIYDDGNKELLRLGTFSDSPAIETDLGLDIVASLLWNGTFYLKGTIPIRDKDGIFGKMVIEEPLRQIARRFMTTEDLGLTGVTRMCIPKFEHLQCFPDRNHAEVYEVRRNSFDGKATPMSRAANGQTGSFKGLDYRDVNVISGYGPLSKNGLGLVVQQDTEELLEPIREQFKWSIPLLLFLAAVGAAMLRLQITPLASKLLRSERDATDKELRIRTVMDSVGEGIITIDEHGIIESFNGAASAIFGYAADEAIGANIKTLMPPEMRSAHEAGMKRYLAGGAPTVVGKGSAELPGLHKDGSMFQLELAINAMHIDGRRLFVGIVRDITARKKAEHALRSAMQQAELANRAKTEFVANMSHEIRTPLNAVLGMAHLMGNTPLNVDQKKYLEMIRTSGKSLLHILNDILDFSKIEAGRMELSPTQFQLDDLLHALASIMNINAGDKNLELAIAVEPDVPRVLVGDAQRLQQVLVNLVGNAIKFTEQGEVSILVDCLAREANAVTLRFTVCDTGIGMTQAQQDRLFKPFTQADSSMTRQYGGTGLGLTISLRLVELMGGTIEMQSVAGEGSRFHVTMPLAIGQSDQGASGRRNGLGNLRLLVVDDNRTSRDALAKNIQTWRWKADSAASVAQAVQCIRRLHEQGASYDIVLAAWHMQDADGVNIMQAVRAVLPQVPMPVIIMINAFGRGKLMDAGISSQADAFLSKPITSSSLFDTIHETLAKRNDASDALSEEYAPSGEQRIKGHILLVEDNPFNQIVATGILEQAGAIVDVVDDGKKAVDLLREGKAVYDLILMDVQMPVMDGFTATRLIRDELKLTLPVLAMTAGVTESEREHCIASGMNDLIAKPIDVDQMLATLARYLPAAL